MVLIAGLTFHFCGGYFYDVSRHVLLFLLYTLLPILFIVCFLLVISTQRDHSTATTVLPNIIYLIAVFNALFY